MDKSKKSRLEKVLPQVFEWASDGLPVNGVRLDNYCAGQGRYELATIDIYRYGMRSVGESLLFAQNGNKVDACKSMSFGIARLLYADATDLRGMKGSDQFIVSDLDGCTHKIFASIALGSPQLVKPFFMEVVDGLAGGYGVRDGRNPPLNVSLRYAAFGLSIIGDWLGQPLDLDKHALPRDPAWGKLVAHWREPDPTKLLPVLLDACDTHVSRIALTEREASKPEFEFNSVFLAVHPTEILAVLRLRDLLGLPNPAQIDHPLMQTPYAAITCRPGDVSERDELLERYLDTVRKRDPQVLPPGL